MFPIMVYVAKVAEQLHLVWRVAWRGAATPPSYIFHKSHKRRLFSTPLSVHVLGRIIQVYSGDHRVRPVRLGTGRARSNRGESRSLGNVCSAVELGPAVLAAGQEDSTCLKVIRSGPGGGHASLTVLSLPKKDEGVSV